MTNATKTEFRLYMFTDEDDMSAMEQIDVFATLDEAHRSIRGEENRSSYQIQEWTGGVPGAVHNP